MIYKTKMGNHIDLDKILVISDVEDIDVCWQFSVTFQFLDNSIVFCQYGEFDENEEKTIREWHEDLLSQWKLYKFEGWDGNIR